jgi:hypothetical protein
MVHIKESSNLAKCNWETELHKFLLSVHMMQTDNLLIPSSPSPCLHHHRLHHRLDIIIVTTMQEIMNMNNSKRA